MKLRDILDMEEYLKNRCYCQGEIYELNGIFCQIFEPDDECKYFVKSGMLDGYDVTSVICKKSILVFYIENNTITDAFLADATEHNLTDLELLLTGKIQKAKLDSFNDPASLPVDGVMRT